MTANGKNQGRYWNVDRGEPGQNEKADALSPSHRTFSNGLRISPVTKLFEKTRSEYDHPSYTDYIAMRMPQLENAFLKRK